MPNSTRNTVSCVDRDLMSLSVGFLPLVMKGRSAVYRVALDFEGDHRHSSGLLLTAIPRLYTAWNVNPMS